MMMLETPPSSMMGNEEEGEAFVTPITLMYAQQPLPFIETTEDTKATKEEKEKEKDLRDLLEEQDIGKLLHKSCSIAFHAILMQESICT